MQFDDIITEIEAEYQNAICNYPPFASAHEGLAVLQEEYEELKDEVFKSPRKRDYDAMRKEAVQVAAMAIRFLIDVEPKANSVEADCRAK